MRRTLGWAVRLWRGNIRPKTALPTSRIPMRGASGAALGVLGELPISAKHVQQITERLGEERRDQRDAQVSAMKAGTLSTMYPQPPQVAALS